MEPPHVVVECPSEETIAAFALGKLDEAARAELETHLDVCSTCQFVAADAAHTQGFSVELDWNTTFPRGTLVDGRYEIRRFMARGGMGEVYEAFDRELSERVALKTVNPTASDDARAVRRLKAEVQLARLVSHPNVCRIYDLGTHALPGTRSELHFLTMQFVEGETLGQRVRLAGALPFVEAKKLARELLLALRAAHEAGVLHRDFKSDNVMLKAAPDGLSTAVVLDFGLARGLDREPYASASHANVVGTVGYIAPEHFEGKGYTIASDVFSFGVVWYEMLTGQMPFEAASAPRVTHARPLPVKAPGPVPPPSSLNPNVPKALDALVLRCLERAPEKRFASVAALLAAIEDATEGPTVARRRLLLAASIIGSGLVAVGVLLLLSAPGAETRSIAERVPIAPIAPVASPTVPASPPAVASNVTGATPLAKAERSRSSTKQLVHASTTASVVDVTPSANAAPVAVPASPALKKAPDWENPFPTARPEFAAGAKPRP